MSTPRSIPTIALVAVPGSYDGQAGDAARSVSDLLLRLRTNGRSRYTTFVERSLRIPTRPAQVNPRSAPNVAPDLRWSPLAEQHPFLRTQLQYAGAAARDREEDSPDHQLMRAQLADYRSTGEPYETIRLEGERFTDHGDGRAAELHSRLHVYEVRMADLGARRSRVGRAWSELYRLFVHVGHLGRSALDHARLEHIGSRLWRLYGITHSWALRAVSLLVPAIAVGLLTTLGALTVASITRWSTMTSLRLGVAIWFAAVGALAAVAYRAYERLRPGALIVGAGTYAVMAGSTLYAIGRANSVSSAIVDTLHVYELHAMALGGAWMATACLGVIATMLGLVAVTRAAAGATRQRAWRATRTALATLAIVTTSTLIAIFVAWLGLARAVATLLPSVAYESLLSLFERPAETAASFVVHVAVATGGAGIPLLVVGAACGGAVLLAAALPILMQERRLLAADGFVQRSSGPTSPRRDEPVDTDVRWTAWERLRREGDVAQRLGRWLSVVLGLAVAIGLGAHMMVAVVAPLATMATWAAASAWTRSAVAAAESIVLGVGGLLMALAVAAVLLRGRLASATLGVRGLIDAFLSMDDYLRTHPRGATPRARLAERYVSVLRYLCQWRDGQGRPYDAIIIVAQSHGVVVTADLLNFIQREEDPELEPLRRPLDNGAPDGAGRRLFLLTMGSPLRQLYATWFPHLFSWVRGERGDGVARALPAVPREPWMLLPRIEDAHRVVAPAIRDDAAPDPYAMGVTRWVNVYRSADYVGRTLWRTPNECEWVYRQAPDDAATRFVSDLPPVTYVSEDAHRSRRELCIGAGAHGHYWDATAKGVAVELDLLVADATRLATRVAKDTGAPAEG